MSYFITSWLINALSLYIVARILPGINIANLSNPTAFITKQGLISCIIGGFILGLFNSCLKPILKFLALPLTCLTLGLFTFVITGFIFYLTSKLTPGMSVDSFWWAMGGGVVFGILNSLLSGLFGVHRETAKEEE